MRVSIKTKGPVKDKDIKAIYLMNEAMKMSSDKMREANMKFIAGKWEKNLSLSPLNSTI